MFSQSAFPAEIQPHDQARSVTPGDVVWLPFTHVEDKRVRSRPAVIVATSLAGTFGLCWALMITSADNLSWPEDVPIDDYASVGLPVRSSVRTAKIATLAIDLAIPIGRLSERTWQAVRQRVASILDDS